MKESKLDNPLPNAVNWTELNQFLKKSGVLRDRCSLLSDGWKQYVAMKSVNLSHNSYMVLKRMHEDLSYFFHNAVVRTSTGKEDRPKKYEMLWELLHSKYCGIEDRILNSIYDDFMFADR